MDRPLSGGSTWRRRLTRGLDLLAVAVVLTVLVRLFVLPRLFEAAVTPEVPFVLPALESGEFRLPARPGRVVFLDFWASWCEPCKASLPLVEHYARRHRDVELLAIDTDEPREIGARFAREEGLRSVLLDSNGRVKRAYGVDGFPTIVVIDPRGFIRARWPGFNPAIELAMDNARTTFEHAQVVSTMSP
ncbi:MAG TPA: TlpA disulfide reductase family protein [Candidatus Baltobacteraceae bacterium]